MWKASALCRISCLHPVSKGGNVMKKTAFAIVLLLGLLLAVAASAETASYGKFTADVEAEYIDLGDVQVKKFDTFITFLEQFPNLKKVDMFSTRIYPDNIDKLAEAFPDVEFGWTMCLGDHRIRTDTTAFSTLHGNSSSHHTEKQFKYLKYCKNLRALDIGHNSVKDVSFLYDLPHLKVLILACNTIEDITPVGSLTELEYLELFKNDIKDISCLENCTNLLDLNICFNHISDWSVIKKLTKLERLWLFNSNNWSDQDRVDPQIIAELQEALPNCHIDSTSYSTLGGWRDHKRYYVVFNMFKYSEYIPFFRGK